MVIQKKLHTVEEFEHYLARPENRGKRLELVNGEITEKMPTREHGIIAGKIVTEFNLYLRQHPIGWAAVEARHRPLGDDKNDRLPDVSFVSDRQKPIERQGLALYMPDLAVEIKSPDDSYTEMREDAAYYLANGSQMVWLVYPEKRLIEVYQLDADIEILAENDFLDGGDLLPGFRPAVRDVFI